MKRFKLAIAAIVIAAGSFATFAFTNQNNEVENEKTFATTYYVLDPSTEMYERFGATQPSNDNCTEGGEHKCAIGFPVDHGEQLDPNNLPTGQNYSSLFDGWYE